MQKRCHAGCIGWLLLQIPVWTVSFEAWVEREASDPWSALDDAGAEGVFGFTRLVH